MITISSKSRYGLKALLELAPYYQGGAVSLKEISERQNISRQYLEQIFNQLVKAGLVRSIRGKNGGYVLAKSPEETYASDIIFLLEGGIEFDVKGDVVESDAISDFLRTIQEKFIKTLNVSLAELLARHQINQNMGYFDI